MMKFGEFGEATPIWQAAGPSASATRVLPVPLLPGAMVFSRRGIRHNSPDARIFGLSGAAAILIDIISPPHNSPSCSWTPSDMRL